MDVYKRMQEHLSEFYIERITMKNLEQYEECFYCNKDYYMITDGHPATKEICVDTIEYCPADFSEKNIYNIGVSQAGKCVCTLFLLYGYPEKTTIYIGLFLVNEQFKRQGVGTKVIKTLFKCFSNTKIERFSLSVQDNNICGCKFWQSLGFKVVDKTRCDGFVNLSLQYDYDS